MKPSRPTSETAKRVAAIMHHRPTTKWMPKEIKVFLDLMPIDESELASIERYYRMNWPPTRGKNALRTDLYTLLNNWSGELGRADRWNEAHPDKPLPRKIIPLPLTGKSEPPVLTPEEEAQAERFREELRRRNPNSKAFRPRSAFDQVRQVMKGDAS